MKYILASGSPRRKELLTQAGFTFTTITSDAEETITREKPSDIVQELAMRKASAVFKKFPVQEDMLIIGADTIVVYKDEILGKPTDEEDAFNMLSMLSDRTHQVYTGVCLIYKKDDRTCTHTFYESTDVTFYPINRYDLIRYVETGDPLDKAGSYGIQGPFAIHIKKISGDYNNVVGLPIARLYHELMDLKLL